MDTRELNNVDTVYEVNANMVAIGYDKAGQKYIGIAAGALTETGYAGCRWAKDSANTEGEPCGSIHKILMFPQLIGLGCYLVQNNHSRRKLSADNSYKFEDGSAAALDGSMGHYQWGTGRQMYYSQWEDAKYCYEAFDIKPIPGHWNYLIPVFSRSATGNCAIDRTNSTLVSYINASTQYRGGNNDVGRDALYTSQLGKCVSNMPTSTLSDCARKNGNMWDANLPFVQYITGALMRVLFHNRNIQAAFNSSLTAEGLRQGGMSPGLSQITNDWAGLDLSAGADKGDITSVLTATMPSNGGTTNVTFPSFFGLKNWFKSHWCMYNGQCFVCNPNGSQNAFSIEKWSGQALNNTTTNDKVLVATTPPQSGGNWMWTTKLSSNRLCGIPTAAGGSETTYYADGYYNPGVGTGLFGVIGLGHVDCGGWGGSACVAGNNAPGYYYVGGSAFLCEADNEWSLVPFMV
jgi:hypothetical protein